MIGTATAATLFSDDFQDGNTTGWSKSGGEWSVVSRRLAGPSSSPNWTVSWPANSPAAPLDQLHRSGAGQAHRLRQHRRLLGIAARSTGATTMYRLVLLGSRAELQTANGSSVHRHRRREHVRQHQARSTRCASRSSGSTISGFVNGTQVGSGSNSQFGAGRIGLLTFHATARFDDVLVTDTAGPPPSSPPPTSGPSRPPPSSPPPTQPAAYPAR